MAMVISGKAKGIIGAFIVLIMLSAVLVTASTKGWLFGLNKADGEHVAARIQVLMMHLNSPIFLMMTIYNFTFCGFKHKTTTKL
jgi:hypothetical protein